MLEPSLETKTWQAPLSPLKAFTFFHPNYDPVTKLAWSLAWHITNHTYDMLVASFTLRKTQSTVSPFNISHFSIFELHYDQNLVLSPNHLISWPNTFNWCINDVWNPTWTKSTPTLDITFQPLKFPHFWPQMPRLCHVALIAYNLSLTHHIRLAKHVCDHLRALNLSRPSITFQNLTFSHSWTSNIKTVPYCPNSFQAKSNIPSGTFGWCLNPCLKPKTSTVHIWPINPSQFHTYGPLKTKLCYRHQVAPKPILADHF